MFNGFTDETVQYLLDHGAKVILCSHLGRPKGQVKKEFSLAPVAQRLKELLPGVSVKMADDCIGDEVKKEADELEEGQILLLENLLERLKVRAVSLFKIHRFSDYLPDAVYDISF